MPTILLKGDGKLKTKKGSLKSSFMLMTILPIIFLGLIVASVLSYRLGNEIYREIDNEMRDMAFSISNMYERFYPGDYNIISDGNISALRKGDKYLEDSVSLLENIKEDTNYDISIIYKGIRYITTLSNSDGNSIKGSKVGAQIQYQVSEKRTAAFFRKVNVDNQEYVAYYLPLRNAGEDVVGMIGIVRSSEDIRKSVFRTVMPILVVIVVSTIVAGLISAVFSAGIISNLNKLKRFLGSVEAGDLSRKLDETVSARDDEIGEMGHTAENMQRSIKKLVERDALTGIYNRRQGSVLLERAVSEAAKDASNIAICIGDIDFFKKVNDTYGHEAGDKVLIEVAATINSFMRQKGFVARWGGEEFLIVFDNEGYDKAHDSLNELLSQIHLIEINSDGQIIKVNMSFGLVKPMLWDEEDGFDALKRADELLYYAKEHGRNQVVGETDVQ